MAYRVRILRTAQTEYRGIVDYLCVALVNPVAASRFIDEFRTQVDLLSSHPYMRGLCHLPEAAALGYRSCPVGNYVILYKVRGDIIILAHVFHQSQDYSRLV